MENDSGNAGQARRVKKHHDEPQRVVDGVCRTTVNGGASTACYVMPVTLPDLACLRQ